MSVDSLKGRREEMSSAKEANEHMDKLQKVQLVINNDRAKN